MSKLESPLKTEFVKQLKDDGWYARRLEEKFAVGVPDILLAVPFGPAMLIEAKRFTSDWFEPSPRQKIDLDAWEAKSNSHVSYRMAGVLGFKGGLCYLGPVLDRLYTADCIIQQHGERNSAFVIRYWNWRLTNAK